MQIALFGRSFGKSSAVLISGFFSNLQEKGCKVYVHEPLVSCCIDAGISVPNSFGVFKREEMPCGCDFVFSIGGDGTFLRAAQLVQPKNTALVGINTGRLGFLADIAMKDATTVLDEIISGHYIIEERTALALSSANGHSVSYFSLNEIAVLRRDTSSLIVVNVYLNNQFLSAYWADGLIIATPTGSTAYSLSAGGPILHPSSANLVITPIAPHSLTVRPLVIPDDVKIRLEIESRSPNFLVSVDSQSYAFDTNQILEIERSTVKVKVVQRLTNNFYETMRNKLMWGKDIRNE